MRLRTLINEGHVHLKSTVHRAELHFCKLSLHLIKERVIFFASFTGIRARSQGELMRAAAKRDVAGGPLRARLKELGL